MVRPPSFSMGDFGTLGGGGDSLLSRSDEDGEVSLYNSAFSLFRVTKIQ